MTDRLTPRPRRRDARRAGPHAAARPGRDLADASARWPRDRRVIPVVRRLLADAETPVGVYRKLAQDEPGTFLLESAEHGGVWSRYSIVGARSRATLTERDGEAHWIGEPPVGVPDRRRPAEALRDTVAALRTPRASPGLPPLTGGLVGAITYDAVRRWEQVPDGTPDELDLPELAMMLATDLAVLDHSDGSLLLVANAVNYDATDERVERGLGRRRRPARPDDRRAGRRPAPSTVAVHASRRPRTPRAAHTPEQFHGDGRGGQGGDPRRRGLPGRRSPSGSRVDCPADALDVYRVLRASQPQPVHVPPAAAAPGRQRPTTSSAPAPRRWSRSTGRRVITHPIAGSRPRGETPEDDVALAEELLADDKERAEHLMLVDLARNDLSGSASAGTVDVVEFMTIRALQPHHAPRVDRRRRPAARPAPPTTRCVATFPAGTLSGAPEAARDGAHRRARAEPRAASTAASSATSTSPATSTWRSRSAPR